MENYAGSIMTAKFRMSSFVRLSMDCGCRTAAIGGSFLMKASGCAGMVPSGRQAIRLLRSKNSKSMLIRPGRL